MKLGNKIKSLRLRAGLTQEMLAEELGVSFQTISKWENSVCAPDISMLPKLSVYFGVTIDELFDLTTEQRLHRIEHMLELQQELSHSTFVETTEFLQGLLEGDCDKARINSLLAHVYHHRVLSDCEKVNQYAKKAMKLAPEKKDCQWLLQKTEGAAIVDWNIKNHQKVISFYKELIQENPKIARPYLYLLDNLIEDHRTKEAREYLEVYRTLKDSKAVLVPIYEANIALAEHNVELAEKIFKELEEKYPENGDVLFELGNYHAKQCHYEKALQYYEKSFDIELKNGIKPVYVDALEAIAVIYEIQEKYEEAIKCYDRELKHLEVAFGYTEGEPIREVMSKKQKVMDLLLT